jgi:hypothetical protein
MRNGVSIAAGKVGQSFGFDGANDYISVPANPTLPTGGSARAVEGWIYTRPSSWAHDVNTVFESGSPGTRQMFGIDMWPYPSMEVYTFGDDLAVSTGAPAEGWLHFAATYDGDWALKMYINGALKGSRTLGAQLNTTQADWNIGRSNFLSGYFDGLIDEFSVYNRPLTEAEVKAIFDAGSSGKCKPEGVVSLGLDQSTAVGGDPVIGKVRLSQAAGAGGASVLLSSSSGAATVPNSITIPQGSSESTFPVSIAEVAADTTVTVTAAYSGKTKEAQLSVLRRLSNTAGTIDPSLAAPAANALYEIPVVIINYYPTADGINLNATTAGFASTLTALKGRVERMNKQIKFMLEQGSRFRGYAAASASPSLGYRVVKIITVHEAVPLGFAVPDRPGVSFADYNHIISRAGGENLVNRKGVKEFWLWAYDHGGFSPVESNMSSPLTGDISNSHRFNNDMPVYDRTYTVYTYNYSRTASEAVHNHGHQLESILSYANQRQDGNTALFWQKFVGRDASFNWQRGRAGDTHHPPNALQDYDYSNTSPFDSDIADWTPARSGQIVPVSLATWRNISYAWPDGVPPPQDDAWWYLYWFQNMPGRNNGITYGSNRMTNWWDFTADWDAAIAAGLGLYNPAACGFTLSGAGQSFTAEGGGGSVLVSTGNGCRWIASSNAPWISISSSSEAGVNFTVAPNPVPSPRAANITVAGQFFSVSQAANPAPTVNIDNSEDFVRQHYRDFLNREPDAEGLAFWTGEIEGCGADAQCREVKRINVSAAFFLSIEFQQTGYMAYRARKAAFGNLAGKPVPITRLEMLADMQLIGSGVIVGAENWEQKLEQNKQAYFSQFEASERFSTLYPQTMTPEAYVDALNLNAGGALTQAERDALIVELKSNAKTRAQALRAVAEDETLAKAEFNKAFVLMQYFGYLRRDPDSAPDSDFSGYNFWLGKLNEFNGNFIQAEMVKAFLNSIEYRQRFGQ